MSWPIASLDYYSSELGLDTGPLVALLNRRDANHTWAAAQAQQLAPPFFTCEAVLSEAHHLLQRAPGGNIRLNELLAMDRVQIAFSYPAHAQRIHALMAQYANVPMSFADACLVCMAEQHENGHIFTTDRDFLIYRKQRNQALDVLLPA